MLPAPQQLPVRIPDLQPHGDDGDEEVKTRISPWQPSQERRMTVSVPRNLVSAAVRLSVCSFGLSKALNLHHSCSDVLQFSLRYFLEFS